MSQCPECGRDFDYNIKTTCRACYQRQRKAKMGPATCHPDRKEHCAGLCGPCYRAGGRAKRADCHPDRLQVAKGLCQQCYNNLPENKERDARKRRLRKYGLSEREYQTLIDVRGWRCWICDGAPKAIDHDHITGKVRGLLCLSCNTGLGQFRDSTALLGSAIRYLQRGAANDNFPSENAPSAAVA